MPELTIENAELVLQACRDRLEAIGQSLNQCFDAQFRLSLGEPRSREILLPDLAGPGVLLAFSVGASAMLCAIPESLPIPDWYKNPSQSQTSRLETLARELSQICFPDNLPADSFVSLAVPVLSDCIAQAEPLEGGRCVPLLVGASLEEQPAAKIWLIWPARRVPAPGEPRSAEAPVTQSPAIEPAQPEAGVPGGPAGAPAPRPAIPSPIARLRHLPVPIIVKLAEKRIELGQFIGIGTGAVITFEKSCEDLLDLYVNNQLYCRGEAVKIGEKFGIKICEVGSVEERISAVLAID